MEGTKRRLEIGCGDCGSGEGLENLQRRRVASLAQVAPAAN